MRPVGIESSGMTGARPSRWTFQVERKWAARLGKGQEEMMVEQQIPSDVGSVVWPWSYRGSEECPMMRSPPFR
jgi:hypothetical protein